jgi:hypothetical protein
VADRRVLANHRTRVRSEAVADRHVGIDHDVGIDARVGADRHILADDRVGADRRARTDCRARRDSRRFLDDGARSIGLVKEREQTDEGGVGLG